MATTAPDTAPSTSRDWHAVPIDTVAARLGAAPDGLTDAEAAARLARHGPNALPETPPTSVAMLLVRQVRNPLIMVLFAATVVTVILREWIDAGVIAAVILLDAVIGAIQEGRAETSVRALSRMVAPRAHVVRAGREHEIASRDLVPGDLVLLESGVRVPADIRLAETTALLVDESPLTGESVPVAKGAAPLPAPTVLADRANMVFAGTTVASGRGRGYVVATGTATELGAIASQVRSAAEVRTPLETRMAGFARVIGVAVGVAALLAFAIGLARGEAGSDMFLIAVALAVSAIPEGLPVATTIALAVGVRRMARRNAIVRHLPAVETLGSTTSIASDKTGTLTENRMTVQRIWTPAGTIDVADGHPPGSQDALRLTLLAGTLANEASIVREEADWAFHGDPTEAALLVAAHRLGLDPAAAHADHRRVRFVPFEPDRQYAASVHECDGEATCYVKGAPERVLAMSSRQLGADGPEPLDREAVLAAAHALAADGLRVLAMAIGPGDAHRDHHDPEGLTFVGLQGMVDPPREGVRDAIVACQAAGIRTIMVTGDHAATARAIGARLGLAGAADRALTGAEIAELDAEGLREAVGTTSIFARVAPDQKLRIVAALQDRGDVVAVTGDGVNDAPALKAADIGVAMGRSGTDVARESADMVLADDNFVSIVAAVEEGRVTFDNIRKVTFFLVATGAAEIVAILAALVLGWPVPFVAAQIIWLNLVTNGLQDVALAFEPGEPDTLARRPRARGEGLLSRVLWERTAISAVVMAAGTLAMFRWELDRSDNLVQAQTVALTTMVLYQVVQAGNARSETRSIFRVSPLSNPFLFIATAAALLVHIGALWFPPAQTVLRMEPIPLETWPRIVLMALTIAIASEAHKWLRRRRPASPPSGAASAGPTPAA